MTGDTSYADTYRNIDFRKYPDEYLIGRGEQGVLIAEPYKSEILPHWKFRTPDIALKSATKIYQMFEQYKADNDFVGMDMARKFLQMGWTRSRRYANHSSGKKYDKNGDVIAQDKDQATNPKAKSAKIFYNFYRQAATDEVYVAMRNDWKKKHMS